MQRRSILVEIVVAGIEGLLGDVSERQLSEIWLSLWGLILVASALGNTETDISSTEMHLDLIDVQRQR
jgi:hypothetical protein